MNFCVLTLIILICNVMCLRGIDLFKLSKLEQNEGVTYLTYTRDNQKVALDIRDVNFNDTSKNVFIIHGFESESLDKPLQVKDDLFEYKNDVERVIIVSWLDYSRDYDFVFVIADAEQNSYDKVARFHVPRLAQDLYEKIIYIRENGATFIELIGHCVGGHIAGQTGKLLRNEPVDQIFGLNPAGRYFKDRKSLALDYGDAHNVLVLHTNINDYGFGSEIGPNDIRVNGGEKQPKCKVNVDFCSHNEAWAAFSQYLRDKIANQEKVQIHPYHPYVICLDVSGSMNDSNRLVRAVHSAQQVISNLKSGAFIGIVKFNQQAEIVHGIVEIKGEAERTSLKSSLPSVSSGSTSLGAGLRLSMDMLRTTPYSPFCSTIVLISDGEQMVGESPQHVLKDLQNECITVNSIAIGIEASRDLEELASSTGGVVSYAMEDGTSQEIVGVMQAFTYMFESETGSNDAIINLLSKEVTLKHGEDNVHYTIEETIGEDTEFKFVSYEIDKVNVKLISPNVEVFTSSSSEYFYDSFGEKGFRIPEAVPGQWNFTVSRISKTKRSVQSTFLGTVAVKTHQLTNTSTPTIRLSAVVSHLVLEYPKPITISAELRRGEFPIINAEVYANIRAPNQPIIRLEMYDNGIFPDELANDGIYKADIKKLPKAERYSVIVIARSNGTAMLVPKKIDYFIKDIVDCKSISCTKLNEFEREADAGSIKLSSTKNENKIPPSKVDDLRGMIENGREKLIALEWTSPNDKFFDIKVKHYDIRALTNGTNFENGLKFNANDLVQGSLEADNSITTKDEKVVIKIPDHIWNSTVQNVKQLKFALKSVGLSGEISERSNIAYVIINKNNTVADVAINENAVTSSSTRLRSGYYNLMFFSIVPALVLLFLFNIFI